MAGPRDRGGPAALFATTLALSAFLLFAVQPLFGRLALPASASLAWWLFRLMATTIGGPSFLALAATAPLLPRWFARAVEGKRDPYPLYAA